jgi:hypothetical protein
MKDLNKYTKAELISRISKYKIDRLEKRANNQTIFNRLTEVILALKGIIIKLTVVSLLVKVFKKYKIFRRCWFILNTTVMSIFGISLVDSFGVDFISNFFNEIRWITYSIVAYFSNTTFYSFVASLFKAKEDVKQGKIRIRELPSDGESSWETTRNETKTSENKRNSRISEWLKPEPEPEESSNKNII